MKKSLKHTPLSKRVLQGAVIYLVIFFTLFFFTNWVGTKLNWLFWLLPPFYALHISQLHLSKKLLHKLLKQRLSAVTIVSFIGTYCAYISFPLIVLVCLEIVITFGWAIKQKQFLISHWSLLLLITPLLYFITTRMYYAGLLNWITTAISFVVLVIYWFAKRKGFLKRLFIPK